MVAAGKHVPSLASLKKYAAAVGCSLRVELVPSDSTRKKVARSRTQQSKAASKKGAAALATFRTTCGGRTCNPWVKRLPQNLACSFVAVGL